MYATPASASLAVYEQLLQKSRQVLGKARWLDLEPEDLAATVYLRMFHPVERKRLRLIDRVRNSRSADAYVAQVVRNAALTEARRHLRETACADVVERVSDQGDEQAWEDVEHATSELFEAIGALNESQRNTLLWRLVGRTTEEIAALQGRKYGSVASDLSRGLTHLQRKLQGTEVSISQRLASRIQEIAKKIAKNG